MIRIISIVVATLLFCYIVFVSFFFREIRQDSICQDLQVVVKDSLDKHFVSESDLVSILKKAGLDPDQAVNGRREYGSDRDGIA